MIKTYSTADGQTISGLKPATLAKYARLGLVRGARVGRRWRLDAADLEALVRRGTDALATTEKSA